MKSRFLFSLIFGSLIFTSCETLDNAIDYCQSLFVKEENLPVIVDYEGCTSGADIPDWVYAMADGDNYAVAEELNIPETKMIFVVQNRGEDLDSLKTQTNHLDGRAAVIKSINQIVVNVVSAEMKGSSDSQVNKTVTSYTSSVSAMSLNGLIKEKSYWVKTSWLKSDVKKAKSPEDYESIYTYYVVFSMDKKLYNQTLEKSLNGVKDSSDNSTAIKKALLKKLKY